MFSGFWPLLCMSSVRNCKIMEILQANFMYQTKETSRDRRRGLTSSSFCHSIGGKSIGRNGMRGRETCSEPTNTIWWQNSCCVTPVTVLPPVWLIKWFLTVSLWISTLLLLLLYLLQLVALVPFLLPENFDLSGQRVCNLASFPSFRLCFFTPRNLHPPTVT